MKRDRILKVLTIIAACFLLFIFIQTASDMVKQFEDMKVLRHYADSIIYTVSMLLFAISAFATMINEHTNKFKVLKIVIMSLLIISFCITAPSSLSIVNSDFDVSKSNLWYYIARYIGSLTYFSAILVYSFNNIILNAKLRKFSRYFCLISILTFYVLTWIILDSRINGQFLTIQYITVTILEQLSYVLIILYGTKKIDIPPSDYIELKFPKKIKLTRTVKPIYTDEPVTIQQVSIVTDSPVIEKQPETIETENTRSIKISLKYILITALFAFLTLCTLYTFSNDKVNNKFSWINIAVISFYSFIFLLTLLLADRKKQINKALRRVKTTLLIVSVAVLITSAALYTIERAEEISFLKIYRSLLSVNQENVEVIYFKDSISTTVLNGKSGCGSEFIFPFYISKRSLYFDKIEKESEYIKIIVQNKYEIEILPHNSESVLMTVNKTKGNDVTYLLELCDFDYYRNGLYDVSGFGMLKDNYEDISSEAKKELTGSALLALEDINYSSQYIDNKLFYRHNKAFAYANYIPGTGNEYYKDGYLYTKDYLKGNYKVKYSFNSELYLQKETEYLDIVKEILKLNSDDFKIKDSYYFEEYTIYLDKVCIIKGITTRYHVEMTFKAKELLALTLFYEDNIFSAKILRELGDNLDIYSILLYPTDLNTYKLKE